MRASLVQQLIDELEVWQGKKSRSGHSVLSSYAPSTVAPPARFTWKWVAIGVAALVLVVGAGLGIRYATHHGIEAGRCTRARDLGCDYSVLQRQADPSLDWVGSTISEMLIPEIGQSARLHLISASRVQEVLHDLHFRHRPRSNVSSLNNIKGATDAETVISGQLVKAGDQYRVNAVIHDLKNGREIPVDVGLTNVKDLTGVINQLAKGLREKIATSPTF